MADDITEPYRTGSSRRGRSSEEAADSLARGLGWFSIALGVTELLAPGAITRSLGMGEHKGLVRCYGLREIGAGVGILTSRDPAPWVWGRVGGGALDLVTVAAGLGGRRKGSVALALAVLAGVTAVDVMCAQQLSRDRRM